LTENKRTLADYFDQRPRTTGAPDYTSPRYERLKRLVVNGQPLGDYDSDARLDRRAQKVFIEMQWTGIALVGCDADLEITSLQSLDEEHGKTTPDFEVMTKAGQRVLIEHSRLVVADEMQEQNARKNLLHRIQVAVDKRADFARGTFYVRFYSDSKLNFRDLRKATPELLAFLECVAQKPASATSLREAGPAFPTLHRLGVHVAYEPGSDLARVVVQAPMTLSSHSDDRRLFQERVDEKKAKFGGYNVGVPVWLVLSAESPTTPLKAISIVEQLRYVDSFDPRPFARVMLGCLTAGVTFSELGKLPKYTSLDTTG
jgi:hypothetical protein